MWKRLDIVVVGDCELLAGVVSATCRASVRIDAYDAGEAERFCEIFFGRERMVSAVATVTYCGVVGFADCDGMRAMPPSGADGCFACG